MPTHDTVASARKLLYEHFGYSSFRPAQETLISALMEGRDVLGIMPTGAGKSMCYQIPALMLAGNYIGCFAADFFDAGSGPGPEGCRNCRGVF